MRGSGLAGALGRRGGNALGLLGGGLDLALGDLADGLAGLQRAGEDFLAGVDTALDVLAGNLHALRPQGLVAVGVAHFAGFAQERERGVGVLLQGAQLQREHLLRVLQGDLADLGGGVGELAGGGGKLLVVLVVLVHGGFSCVGRGPAGFCRFVRCTITQLLLRRNISVPRTPESVQIPKIPCRSAPCARSRVTPGSTAQREGPAGQPLGGTIGAMDGADKPTWVRQCVCEALLRALPNARRLCRRAGPAKRGFTCVSRQGVAPPARPRIFTRLRAHGALLPGAW